MEILFFIGLFIILYTYIGYGIVLFILAGIKRRMGADVYKTDTDYQPAITVIIAAYNEEAFIKQKIENCLSLDYPSAKSSFIVVTDGSIDATPSIVAGYPQVLLLNHPERQGKIAAIHRAMEQVQTELVVFTDANTLLNKDALRKITRHYTDIRVGAVAGEKRVSGQPGATAGEGWYWRYESYLKKWESELYSVMGAAGELFSIRAGLYERIPEDTLVDDFLLSMHIMQKGYSIRYEPAAYATETASENMREEWKRKIRIAAGGMQALVRSGGMFSLRRPWLLFEYISHRVLRWAVAPWLLVIIFLLNLMWVLEQDTAGGYMLFFLWLQVIWYATAVLGWLLQRIKIDAGLLYVPYYFCMMNAAMIVGMFRFISGKQTVFWEKAERTV